jgi:hypothetical protein
MLDSALEIVKLEFANLPNKDEFVEKVAARLTKTYHSPPVKDFEILFQKPFTDDEVRTALFSPLDTQVKFYPMMLLVSSEIPASNPIKKTASLMLTLIFLLHR